MIEDIVIQYRADTTDLARARKELGLVDEAQNDLLEEFKKVNATAQAQVQVLAAIAQQAVGGTQAAGDQQAAIQEVAAALAAEAKAAAAASQAEAEGRKEAAQAARLQAAEADRARKAALKAAEDEANAVGLLGKKLKEINDLKEKKLKIVDEAELAKANAALEKLESEYRELNEIGTSATKKQTEETGFFGKALGEIGPLIAGAFAVDKLLEYGAKIISITAETQKYKAVLTNTLGSETAAADVMERISKFAAATPFSIQELTQSYVKLANQGFKPTNDQLRQLGDLASSTGKSFDELTEAILDAQQGEFERLKEFGIAASKNGDKVTFTFKEQKTVVDASASSIQKYLLGLGDLQGVSGSMAAISGTLDGQLSNLGDTFDQLFLAIGQKGSPVFKYFIDDLNGSAQALTNLIKGAQDNTKSNLALSEALKPMLARYDELKSKSSLTKDEQAELQKLIAQIAKDLPTAASSFDQYGNVVAIATAKVRDFITASKSADIAQTNQKLAEQRQRYKEIEEQISGVKKALANRDGDGDLQRTNFEASAEDAAAFGTQVKLSGAEVTALQEKLKKLYGERAQAGGAIDDLKGLGKAAAEIGEGFKTSGDGLPGLIKEIEDEVKRLTALRPGIFTEEGLAANKKEIDALNERLRVLNELGTVYGALGIQQKKLADEERNRSKLNETQLAASNQRIEKIQEEIKRLNELGLATGIVGQIQKEMSKIQDSIPKLKTEVEVTEAYKKLDQLQARLDALHPPKFELPTVGSFLDALDKQVKDQQTVLDKAATQYATYSKQQNLESLQALKQQLEAGEITRDQYAQRRQNIEKGLSTALLQNELDTVNAKLRIQDLSDDERTSLEAKRVEIQQSLYDQDVENYTEAQQKKADIESELRDQTLQAATALVNQLFDNEAKALADKLSSLQAAHDYEVGLAGNTADAKGKIDQAYAAKEAAIRKQQNELAQKQALFNKALAISQIAINTALGITKVIAEVPKVDFGITTGILIAAYAALGAIQAGLVIAQPVPKFAKGTDFVKGGTPGQDSVHALLMPGERVVTTATNREYYTTLSAIHRGEVPAPLLAQFVLDYKYQNSKFAPPSVQPVEVVTQAAADQAFQDRLLRAISERPVQTTIFDDQGSRTYIERQGSRTQSLNNKYSF